MRQKSCPVTPEPAVTEEQVAAYLAANPVFFVHHPELLSRLTIPHECGEAVSLLEYQVALLRQTNRSLERQLDNLVQIARDNDRLLEGMHRLTLVLLQAETVAEGVAGIEEGLWNHFGVERVVLRFFQPCKTSARADVFVPAYHADLFQDVLETREPYIGSPASSQLEFLFSSEADGIGSCALVPLRQPDLIGVLAIGSRDRQRFYPGLGKVFLARLGELVGARLENLLQAEASDG
ncbi:DUF484 family protein [Methylohalobius crimeensis]|uniref:DUF484 family protein n=1 Tax=Methylohalobius crimeensis TaxID=244365 RepID=UPI0003B4E95E|nr:DUF484 family protein [Methylohalobius crimeensis]